MKRVLSFSTLRRRIDRALKRRHREHVAALLGGPDATERFLAEAIAPPNWSLWKYDARLLGDPVFVQLTPVEVYVLRDGGPHSALRYSYLLRLIQSGAFTA